MLKKVWFLASVRSSKTILASRFCLRKTEPDSSVGVANWDKEIGRRSCYSLPGDAWPHVPLVALILSKIFICNQSTSVWAGGRQPHFTGGTGGHHRGLCNLLSGWNTHTLRCVPGKLGSLWPVVENGRKKWNSGKTYFTFLCFSILWVSHKWYPRFAYA